MIPYKDLPDGRRMLTRPVFVDVRELGFYFVLPAGFRSDGATIPRWLWWLLGRPMDCSHWQEAVAHDWLCEQSTTLALRVVADAIFRHLLTARGVPRWKRTAMYYAVRVAGFWTHFRRSCSRVSPKPGLKSIDPRPPAAG